MLLNSWDTVIQLWQAADTRYWALLPAAREWRKGIKPVTGTEFWDKILISVMHAYTKMHTAGFKRLPRSLIKFYITPDIVEELPKLHFPKTRERTFRGKHTCSYRSPNPKTQWVYGPPKLLAASSTEASFPLVLPEPGQCLAHNLRNTTGWVGWAYTFKSLLCSLLVVWPWSCHLTLLSLSLSLCKSRMKSTLHHYRIYGEKSRKKWRSRSVLT